ncbi:phage scaffolding protein [Ihubacter sp. rT4E-8]|uniref:phage scaffolding protein n=1 Tax=Ihubacter sp. rT4E-8 TaxID=3242369 RepID=UPI003CF53819
MEFLKEILGDDLFEKINAAVNNWNGNDDNKDKQVKLANLSGGEYVGKGKFDALTESLKGKEAELTTANKLIEELKKGTKGNEELQGKISDYESQIESLQTENAEIKLKSAIKVALLTAKATDVDYLTYKLQESLKEKGEKLELDENDNIKGWDNRLEGLKTQFSNMFESDGSDGGYEPYKPEGLPKGNDGKSVTKEQFKKMTYEERVKLKEKDEKLYQSLKK